MAKVILYQGDTLVVQFADTDGEFTIDFDTQTYPGQLVLRESDGLPGNVAGAASAILYHEDFRKGIDPNDVAIDEHDDGMIQQPVGFFMDASGKIHCTALVSCIVRILPGGKMVVATLADPDGRESEETGEFTFYPTVEALEAALNASGVHLQRPAI